MAYILTEAAQIQCTHLAKGTVKSANTRVKIEGSAVVIAPDVPAVAACPFTTPEPRPSPCITIKWQTPSVAKRVKVNNESVVLVETVGLCKSAEQLTQGTALLTSAQYRVKGL